MELVKSLIYNKRLLLSIRHNLKAGKYVLMPNLRTYCNVNAKNKYLFFPQDGLKEENIKYKILSFLFSTRIKNSNKSKIQGDVVYFTNCPDCENRDIKVFDYDSSRVMIICQNITRYNLHKKIINSSRLFPCSNTLIQNNNELVFVEELFEKKPLTDSSNLMNAISSMIEFYCQYYLNQHNDIELRDGTWFYTQHGDLSIDNIGMNDSQFIIFDFDFIDKYPILYDLWFFAINYGFRYNSTCMIDLMLNSDTLKKTISDLKISFLLASKTCFEFMKRRRLIDVINDYDMNKYNELFEYCIKSMVNIE